MKGTLTAAAILLRSVSLPNTSPHSHSAPSTLSSAAPLYTPAKFAVRIAAAFPNSTLPTTLYLGKDRRGTGARPRRRRPLRHLPAQLPRLRRPHHGRRPAEALRRARGGPGGGADRAGGRSERRHRSLLRGGEDNALMWRSGRFGALNGGLESGEAGVGACEGGGRVVLVALLGFRGEGGGMEVAVGRATVVPF